MTTYLRTVITRVGPDVADLVEGGILILFAEGAPPELAEVSVLHRMDQAPAEESPAPGAELAWKKVRDIGHVVINFNDSDTPDRPGEICASAVNTDGLAAALSAGAEIVIRS